MIPPDSFTFGSKNSYDEWGIKVIAYDVFSAPKRERKKQIPFRNGSYDYGEKWYDDKIIRLDCETESKPITKAQLREVIYHMSQRNRLFLWDEPDKYYKGELFSSSDLTMFPNVDKMQFTLEILCEPFAYREQTVWPLREGLNNIKYGGTAQTPTLLVLKNPNSFPISNITITATQKRY